jgi:hypothetical protein
MLDLKIEKNIKNWGEFTQTKTYFSQNIQKLKYFQFFQKKSCSSKIEFFSYSVPLFIFAYLTSEKT